MEGRSVRWLPNRIIHKLEFVCCDLNQALRSATNSDVIDVIEQLCHPIIVIGLPRSNNTLLNDEEAVVTTVV